MRPVPGILRVTLKKPKGDLFVISQPDVFKSPTSDTYVIFGEAKIEDMSRKAAQQYSVPDASRGVPMAPPAAQKAAPAASTVADDADFDETGVNPKDIELVMQQAQCSRADAIKALKTNDNDIVNAIMELTM